MPPASPRSGQRHRAVRLPDTVVGRADERAAMTRALEQLGQQHLHVAGPRGAGKTLLTAVTLQDTPTDATPCYVPCRRYDTQYRVLAQLLEHCTGEPVQPGYRTAQLQRQAADALQERAPVVVLDDVEFLLRNDGADLLYHLSRLDHTTVPIVTVSTTEPDLTAALDARTASSLQPRQVTLSAYIEQRAAAIIASHATDLCPQPITAAAIQYIAGQTTNIRLGLHWLTRTGEVRDADAVLTAATVLPLRLEARSRYWRDALTAFTRHHALVLTAVKQLVADTDPVYTGPVYDRYTTLCQCRDIHPVTMRRVGDVLDDLELLGLIQVAHSRGGATGKTRAIRLTSVQEL